MKVKKLLISAGALCLAIILGVGLIVSASAQDSTKPSDDLKIAAKSALLMDYDSGKIVFAQNAKEHLPIASMVKIMTLLLTFEQVNSGKLSMTDEIVASENATSMGGSQAFLDTNNSYKLEQLIQSILVGSANDSCVAVAEKISGSVDGFVGSMNAKAKELGMDDTNFVNCTGLPAVGQYSCASDVATMTRELLTHKSFYTFSKVWMFDFKHPSGRITQLSNTNKLIRAYDGCDGGKTGFTNEAMFCLSATAKRGSMRLISVVCGAETSKIRNGENAKLFNYGFANFENKQLVTVGNAIDGEYNVNQGKIKTVKAVAKNNFFTFSNKADKNNYKIECNVSPIQAPINAGDKIGEIIIYNGAKEIGRVDLVSSDTVSKLTYLDIVDDLIQNW